MAVVIMNLFVSAGCGGRQDGRAQLDTRPLEESKAFQIIEEVLAERGYSAQRDIKLVLNDGTKVEADFMLAGHPVAIEFLTEQDRIETGELPPPAAGSRLHVLAANDIAKDDSPKEKHIFVFFIDDRKFVYQYNPTSERRADVTFLEIDSRLRRDLADFISWFETSILEQ